MSWKETWMLNYTGQSPEAKELEGFMKANYKKHNYIPWATMVRLLYTQDPEAFLDVIYDDYNKQIVHTSKGSINTQTEDVKPSKDGTHSLEKKESVYNTHCSNMVVVKCTFLGKTFVEYYPIQDNSYNAPYYYDSNMVNKAIQRAKAKIISIATGLAFRLYEDGDLQFEDDKDKDTSKKTVVDKPSVPTKSEKVVEKIIDDTVNDDENKDAEDLLKLLRSVKPEVSEDILKSVNADMVKIYKFSINMEEPDDVTLEKLKKIKNLPIFTKVIKTKIDRGSNK